MEYMISARELCWQKFLLLLVLLTSCSAQRTYYVTPTPDTPCPGEPCHTLSQYITEQYFEQFSGNVRMEFLPGNHTLEQTISLANITQLTLHGDPYSRSLPEVTSRIVVSVCDSQTRHAFVFTGNIELHISALTFISGVCGGGIAILESEQKSDITYSIFQNISLYVEKSILTVLTENTFQNTESTHALYAQHSSLNLTGNSFHKNSVDHGDGGALYVDNANLNLIGNSFHNNAADHGDGGAVYVFNGNISLIGNTFHNNSAGMGGALFVEKGNLNFTGNTFHKNSAGNGGGGALYVEQGNISLTCNTFHNNSAAGAGGALSIGMFFVRDSNFNLTGNIFHSNSADTKGGALFVGYGNINLIGNTFHNNSAVESGGTLSLTNSNIVITDNNFIDSSASFGGAITADSSNVALYGNNIIANSTAQYGGGITVENSQLELVGSAFTVQNNTARYGGGLYVHNTNISGSATFNANSATEWGGGIYASRSTFYFMGNTTFLENSAIDGGGLFLSDGSVFYLQQNTHVYFIRNSAMRNGGAIKVEDSNSIIYCTLMFHSDCFFQIQKKLQRYASASEIKATLAGLNLTIHFDNNSAREAGADLHGGSVDNCELSNIDTHCKKYNHCPTSGNVFDDITSSKNTPDVSSDPLYICTCRDNRTDCSGSYHPAPVYPGGTLEVPVIAQGQKNGSTTAKIQVIDTPNSNIIFQELETIQNTNKNCTVLKYTIQSTAEHETQEMILYVEGPCPPQYPSPTKIPNTLRILIDVLDCPPGFQLSHTQPALCICTNRLQQFTNICRVDDNMVLREQDARFWVGYDIHSRGVILHPHCPIDYCTLKRMYMAVDDSDKQCNNRSGLLCGRCSENLSLALGSSRCLQCSNSYLILIAAFALAGIALVVLLLVLRLTVAAGTINGLIFYANIVAVNSAIFFQPQPSNVPTIIAKVLTVFIAWMNLDLGIETCFYNGMGEYFKTWLQFAFPFYIWALIAMIIVGSHYSGRVAQIFGSNPIAVLATLFLLSYAKLLRTAITALSYTSLEYPNNSQIAVWLYDGNIRYLSGKHIPLFTAAVVYLVFLFLPYTMLLIFSQWLQATSIFSWINGRNFKPFLDAYHAPYTSRHRYWTGLLLLLRFVLFLIFAVNALGDPSINLLATAATTATLTLHTILGARIYKMRGLSLLEISFILNLTILSVVSYHIHLSGVNQNAFTFTSVGVAFATFIGIVIYHSVQQLKGTGLWRRVCQRHNYTRVPLTDVDSGTEEDPPDAVFVSGSAPTQTVVEIPTHELREPCMATN